MNLFARLKQTHAWNAWERYNEHRGPVLSGGVAYAALFSVFGVAVTGFAVFGLVLGNNEELFNAVIEAADEALPGLLQVPPGSDGAIDPRDLVDAEVFSWAGGTALATALFAGLGWLAALRGAVRAVAGLEKFEKNIVLAKVIDVGVLALLGIAVLGSAVLGLVTSAAGSWLLRLVGLSGSPLSVLALRLAALAVVVLVNAVVMIIVFRLLAAWKLSWAQMRGGVLLAAVGLALLTQFSGTLVGSAGSRNALLATGAVLVGLLVMLNLVARVMLVATSWIATSEAVAGETTTEAEADTETVGRGAAVGATRTGGNAVGGAAAPGAGPDVAVQPTYSARAADRTTLAAGAILGVTAAVAARVLAESARTLIRFVRD